jgi:uncharacterized membrane protein
MKTRKQILWITQTALLLGLTVATQYYLTTLLGGPGNPVSQIAVGSLVNLFLVLAALTCGFWSGASIGSIAPFIAFSLGRLPHVWLIPFISLGNIAIVFAFWLICRKKIYGKSFSVRWAVASILGSLLKFGVLWFGVTQVYINLILVNSEFPPPQIAAMTASLSFTFSFPQLATALTGCILAYAIYPVLKKVLTERTVNAK